MSFLLFIIIGALAGWLAGKLMKGSGYGLIMNILIGIVGSVVGGWVFSLLGIAAYGMVGKLAMATIGAVLILFIAKKLKD